MYILNNPYVNFKSDIIELLSKVNASEFDSSKSFVHYSNIFKEIIKEKLSELNEHGIDRLRAKVVEVKPDIRFRVYSKEYNENDFCDVLYWLYLDDMFSIAMWKRLIIWNKTTKNWW